MTSRNIIGPLGISLICIVICIVALFVQAPPIFAALVQPKAELVGTDSKVKALVEQHAAEAETLAKRFEGRSPFFVPDRPIVKVRPGQSRRADPPKPETKPAPSDYGGPLEPQWSLEQNEIVFTGGVELKIGAESQSVKLVSVNLPYSVTVEWTKLPQGHISYETGTYTIPFRPGLFGGSKPALLTEAPKPGARKLEGGSGGQALPRSGRNRNDPRLRQFQNRNRRSDNDDDEDEED